jgi:hypothetical protein
MRADFMGSVYRTLAIVLIATATQAQENQPDFFPFSVSHDPQTPGVLSARDLLPAPAGKDGFVTVRDGHFYIGDKRIRFWGVNLCFAANFPEHQAADRLAERLANFGVNCVRFHHMDSAPFPRGIFADEKLETLSPEALDRLDYLVAALKKRGIYSNLNLHVSRSWTRSHNWPDAKQLPQQDKMIDLFHPELIEAQKRFARDLLTHVNKYTQLAYCDDPAIAMIEINNENTIFIWDGMRTLARLPEQYKQIVKQRYTDWSRDNPMPRPSIFEPTSPQMHWMRFLQALDESYFVSMRSYLRDELKVKAPITGTIVLGPLGMRSQAKMDFADGHWYWDHPTFPGKSWDSENWRIHNRPMVDSLARSAVRVAASRIAGMPYTVTEYNHSAPNEWQAECIPFVATFGALQDWDGIVLFSYSHDTNYFKSKMSSFFDIEGNPAKMAFLSLGSRIFLSGNVKLLTGETRFAVDFEDSLRLGGKYYQDISGFLRDMKGLKPDDYLRARIMNDLSISQDARFGGDDRVVRWESGEPRKSHLAYSDDQFAMYIGFPNQKSAPLGRVTLHTDAQFIVAMLLPSDRTKTLRDSDRFHLCVMGRVTNTDQKWNEPRTSVGKAWGSAPTLLERIQGEVRIDGKPASLVPLDESGNLMTKRVDRLENAESCWFELSR